MTDNPDFKNEVKYLTAGQCALRYAISLRHFHYLVDLGEMPRPVRFGKSVRWPIESLKKFETQINGGRGIGRRPKSHRKKGKKTAFSGQDPVDFLCNKSKSVVRLSVGKP